MEWDSPLGYQSYYSYRVQTISPTQTDQNVPGNTANLTGLQPATAYNFSVTTTIPDLQGLPAYILCYTSELYFLMNNLKSRPERFIHQFREGYYGFYF